MTEQEYRDSLIEKISRATQIVNDLENCKGFQYVVDDVSDAIKQIDSNWHLVPQDEKWETRIKELRLTKLASGYVCNLVTTYKNEIDRCQGELNKLDNPETEINKDFDLGTQKQ